MDRYSEIMEELEYVTDHDGFVETCLICGIPCTFTIRA